MRILRPAPRPLEDALALGPALLARASAGAAPWMTASLIDGRAVILGAAQRAGRVVDLAACAGRGVAVVRRATTGTAAYAGGRAVIWTLALPHVAALAPDATMRTLLNRNVRGFLQGFARAGAVAHYFGREHVAVRRRPAALLGFDATPDGAVLVEVIAGLDAPVAIPAALAAPEEQAVDRWLQKAPAALSEVLPAGLTLEDLASAVIDAVAARSAAPRVETGEIPELDRDRFGPIADPRDPIPPAFGAAVLARAPIGWIDAAAAPGGGAAWVGGDVLTARWALDAVGRGEDPFDTTTDVPLEGAAPADLLDAAQRARAEQGGAR